MPIVRGDVRRRPDSPRIREDELGVPKGGFRGLGEIGAAHGAIQAVLQSFQSCYPVKVKEFRQSWDAQDGLRFSGPSTPIPRHPFPEMSPIERLAVL